MPLPLVSASSGLASSAGRGLSKNALQQRVSQNAGVSQARSQHGAIECTASSIFPHRRWQGRLFCIVVDA